jgi:hypothetical protein
MPASGGGDQTMKPRMQCGVEEIEGGSTTVKPSNLMINADL